MEKRLKEKLDAMLAFKKFCEENEIVWNSLTGFANCIDDFDTRLESLLKTLAVQEENNKGVTRTKKEQKFLLANETVSVSQALQAYSLTEKNSTLYESMSITFTKISQAKDAGAISASKLVYNTAKGLSIANLEPFGISENILQEMKKIIDDFILLAPTTRNVITNKTVLTKSLNEQVNDANIVMRKQLLKIGRQFKKTAPDFYKGLVANAKVITNSVHSKIRLICIDDATNEPLIDADVEIDGTDLKGKTDKHGKVTITTVHDGKRTVVISKANYIRMSLENVNFQRGHSITRTVEMSPAFDVPAETVAKKESVKK